MSIYAKFFTSVGLALSVSTSYANTISVTPTNQAVNLGDVFSVSVAGTGFSTALDAGGLNLSFDSNIIMPAPIAELPVGVTEIVQFGSDWETNVQPTPNAATLEDAFFFAGATSPSGNFDVFNVWFKAIGHGTSNIDLEESLLNPFAGDGGALSATVVDGTVQVVPLPAAFWLLATGLLGMSTLVRRTS